MQNFAILPFCGIEFSNLSSLGELKELLFAKLTAASYPLVREEEEEEDEEDAFILFTFVTFYLVVFTLLSSFSS